VRDGLTSILRCPACRTDRSLRLDAQDGDEREVRTGELRCSRCGAEFAVAGGIACLLHEPPDFVLRERAGLERFVATMRADGWDRERVLALPDDELPYWQGQRRAMEELLARASPAGRVLDVGSNTCWASRIFAARGMDVVALDIATTPMQGLATADWAFAAGEPFFERVESVMFAPALADASFDCVFCSEVLHHNDGAHLRRTMRELWRVLRPGGRLFVIGEPLRFPLRPKLAHGREVAAYEGNEHVFLLGEYVLGALLAGFRVRLPALRDAVAERPRERPRALARWAWRQVVRGDGQLTMDCVKPARARA
jgi:SAM-dependent methyltransferase